MRNQADFQLVVVVEIGHHIIIIKASGLLGLAHDPNDVHVLLCGNPGINISDSCCVHVVR